MKLVIHIKHIDKTTFNLQKLTKSNGIYMWHYCDHCREVRFKIYLTYIPIEISFCIFCSISRSNYAIEMFRFLFSKDILLYDSLSNLMKRIV